MPSAWTVPSEHGVLPTREQTLALAGRNLPRPREFCRPATFPIPTSIS